ncbi:MAG: radical SAM protein [Clostridia bacterium]|nr:radical SAM protein [Clostridia bacterium]
MKTHRNFSFFVPHAGCPNCCVFCSQTKITGVDSDKSLDEEIKELRAMLENGVGDFAESQIAFFGGSFTAIDRARMEALLEVANEYIDKGVAESIRISTRPDCINEEILKLLAKYRVRNIELGVQSTSDRVLAASSRGHTAKSSFESAGLITENGFTFGGQMMVGLPDSTLEDELQTARDIVSMGASEARIYPTVVFEDTKLCDMAENGEYKPLTLESAVERAAKCYKIFLDSGVKVLRIGLHASENLKNARYGANHPSIGELVKSYVYTEIIAERAGSCQGKRLCVGIRKNDISMLTGHGGCAIERIKNQTEAAEVEIYATETAQFEPKLTKRSV